MQRVESRTYVGQPREVVTVTTQVSGGGQAVVIVNGVEMGTRAQFPLPLDSGDRIKWQIALMGPLGATCVVATRVVDGSSDGDFLICQAHNPAPVHFYTCSVVEAPAMRALSGIRSAKGARKAPTRSKTPIRMAGKKKVRARKAAKKKAAKKKGGRS